MTYNDGIRALAPLDTQAMVERVAKAIAEEAYLRECEAMFRDFYARDVCVTGEDYAAARAALAAMGVK